jgi:endoglucanase
VTEFLQIDGGTVVRDGQPIRLRGVNFGSWLNIEDFMIGLSGCDYQVGLMAQRVIGDEVGRSFIRTYREKFITEDDVVRAKELGFNLVRVPFCYQLFENDLYPGSYEGPGFRYLDRLIDWCRAHDVYVLLDLHAAPGGQNATPPANHANGYPGLWFHRHFQDRTVALWEAIARKYKDEPVVMGYDLLNEPITDQLHDPWPDRKPQLNSFYRRLIGAIRAIDEKHILVIEGNVRQSGGIRTLNPDLFADPNTMCSFHFYPMFQADSIPGLAIPEEEIASVADSGELGVEAMRDIMREEWNFAQEVNRPMLLGEFGFFSDRPQALQNALVHAQLTIAEEWGFHWTLWPWKDVGLMGLYSPSADTPWRRFIDRIRPHVDEGYNKLKPLLNELVSHFDKDETTRLIFDAGYNDAIRGMRRMALSWEMRQLAKLPEETISNMGDSFALENCEQSDWYETVLKPFLQED